MHDYIKALGAYLAFVAISFLLLPLVGPAMPAAIAFPLLAVGVIGVALAIVGRLPGRSVALTLAACALLCLPAFAQTDTAAPGVTADGVPTWAPAVVPLLVWGIKFLCSEVIPDTVMRKLRDELLPLVAVVVGTLGTSIATGEAQWSQGPIVGLAGVGLHQLWRQFGKALND